MNEKLDSKTLADVQPGGMVRLGDALPPLPPMGYEVRGTGMGPHDVYYTTAAYTAKQMRDYALAALSAHSSLLSGAPVTDEMVDAACRAYYDTAEDAVDVDHTCMEAALKAALAAQPSPGGQGAPFPWENFPAYLTDKCEGDTISEEGLQQALAAMAKDERYCLAARPSPGGQGDALVTDAMVYAAEAAYANSKPDNLHESFRDAIAAALAARQPVGEPVALVVPGAPTRCRHCESTDLEWFAHVRAVNDVPHGRLTTHDVGCVFVLGCNECSETLHTVKADSIAALLAAPPAQAVDLGGFRKVMQDAIARFEVLDQRNRMKVLDACALQGLRAAVALIDSQAVGK